MPKRREIERPARNSRLLSVVLACYNSETFLEKSVRRIRDVLDASRYSYELIFVDDGSSDRTAEIVKNLVLDRENERAIFHYHNNGRGKTVADGIKAARGKIAGFIDVDLETDAPYILSLVQEIEKGADVATAHRIYRLRIPHLLRQMLSRLYIRLVRFLLKVPLKDTETGCKFFNRAAILPVLSETKDTHWFWDTEIMVRCYLNGLRIIEIPTSYVRKPETGTTVKLLPDSIAYLKRLLGFYRELKRKGLIGRPRRTI